jgi:hypothetical protein
MNLLSSDLLDRALNLIAARLEEIGAPQEVLVV